MSTWCPLTMLRKLVAGKCLKTRTPLKLKSYCDPFRRFAFEAYNLDLFLLGLQWELLEGGGWNMISQN